MAIREANLNPRDLTAELTLPDTEEAEAPQLLDPVNFLSGEGTPLVTEEEEFELLDPSTFISADLQKAAEEEAARDKIEPIPTPLQFLEGEGDTIKQEVSGTPRVISGLEQAFEPFAKSSILANLMQAAKRTEEDDEASFQEALRTDTSVLELDRQIDAIEREAEGRDLTDPELDRLFMLQDMRDEVEEESRTSFFEEGRIIPDDLSLGDMAEAIYEQPGEFFRGMANEIAKEPELMLAPVGWGRAAQASAQTAKVLGASVRAQKAAAVVGGNLGVGTLAGTIGYATDAAEQLKEKGVVDTEKAMDTAIVSAATGMALTSVFKGGAAIARDRSQTAQFNQLVDESIESVDSEKLLDEIIKENLETNEISLDSANNVVISEKPATDTVTNFQELDLLVKSREQLIAEQEEALNNKMSREDRQVVGQRAQTLRDEIPRMWQDILDAEDRLTALANDERRTPNRRDRGTRSQAANLRRLRETHEQAVVELRTLEEILLTDRDLGLEIVRISEDHASKLDGADVQARAAEIKGDMGPDDLTWLERRQKLRNDSDNKKARPKILKLFDPETETRSFTEAGINPEPPTTAQPVKNALKPKSDTAWNFLVDVTFGKAVSRLDGLAEVSPTAKQLRNIFRHDQEGVQAVPSHTDRVIQRTGKFTQQIDDTMDLIRTTLGGFLKREEMKDVLDVLRGGTGRTSTPEVRKAAEGIRKILDDFLAYAREAGHPVGKVENYVPRVYNTSKLGNPETAARFKILLRSKGLSKERVDEIYEKIMLNGGVLDFDPKTLGTQRVSAETRPLGQRSLDMVDDIELEEFLVNDLYELLQDYIHSGVRTVEFTRSFGSNGSKLYDMIEQIVKETRDSGNIMEDMELKRIIDLANALQGSYNRFQSRSAETMMSGLVTAQQILALPFATITSAMEPFIGLSRTRTTSWAEGMGKAMKSAANRSVRSFWKGVEKDNITVEAEELGLILPHATNEHLANLWGGEVSNRSLSKVSAAFFRTIFLTQWTEFTRVWAQQASKADIIKSLKLLERGDTPEFRKEAMLVDLKESGIDVDAGVNWIRRGGDTKDPFYRQVQEASFRDANNTIVHPDPTNRPIHFSNPKLAWFNMLLSYPTSFTNNVMKRWFDNFTKGNAYYKTQHGVKVAASILSMLMVSDLVLDLKEQLTYGDKGNPHLINETEGERLFRAANQAGFLGPAQIIGDMASSITYGGDAASSRMGPMIGTFNDLAKGIVKLPEDDGDTLKKAATKLFPFLNKSQSARDFIYRDVFQGGRATRESGADRIEFRVPESPRVDRPSIFDGGQPEIRVPQRLPEQQQQDDQASIERLELKIDELTAALQARPEDLPSIPGISQAQAMVRDRTVPVEPIILDAEALLRGESMPSDKIKEVQKWAGTKADGASGRNTRQAIAEKLNPEYREDFVKEVVPQITQIVEQTGTKLLPQTLAAVATLETGWGSSVLGNAYFGVKAREGEDFVSFVTQEQDKEGKATKLKDRFRKYDSLGESIEGVISFLESNPRYEKAGVFEAETPEDQLAALKKAGYATDKNYVALTTGVLAGIEKRVPGIFDQKFEQETSVEVDGFTGETRTDGRGPRVLPPSKRPVESKPETPRGTLSNEEILEELRFIKDTLFERESQKEARDADLRVFDEEVSQEQRILDLIARMEKDINTINLEDTVRENEIKRAERLLRERRALDESVEELF